MNIHPTAVVDPGARLGENVRVGPFAFIDREVSLGEDCEVGAHATLLSYTSIGSGCRVHAGAVIGDLPQDMAFQPCESFVKIGERCVIREGVTIHRGTKPGTVTQVGNDCYLMAMAHLAHNVCLGDNVVVANGTLLAGYVEIGSRAFISGNVLLHQFVRVGRLVMMGGGSGISKDVPPFCMVHGLEINRVSGLNAVGMRRAGITPEQRTEIRRAFGLLYQSGLNVSQAVVKMKEAFSSGPASEIWQFVLKSKRGVCGLSAGRDAEEHEG